MPKNPVDLQTHSTFSPDAQYTPDELFRMAKESGMEAIVITDHNVVRGIKPALAAAEKYGIRTCQGVEISTKHDKADVHVLGYSSAFDTELIEKETKATRDGYNDRSQEIARRITEAGIADIDFDALLKRFRDSYVSKPRIAELIAQQRNITYKEALVYVERGGPGFVPYGDWAMTPHQAVDLIHRANGIAVMAHPGDFYRKRSSEAPEQAKKTLYALLDELIALKLDGLEVYYSKHQPEWSEEFMKFVTERGLLVSGGSDYHGPQFTQKIQMGDGGISVEQFERIVERLPQQ